MRLAKEAQQRQRQLWYAEEEKALADMKAHGVEVVEVADKEALRDAVKPVWDKYGAAARRAGRAHPGGAVAQIDGRRRGSPRRSGRRPVALQEKRRDAGPLHRRHGCAAPPLPVRRRRLPGRDHDHHPVGRVHALRAQLRLVLAGAAGGAPDDLVLVHRRGAVLSGTAAHQRPGPAVGAAGDCRGSWSAGSPSSPWPA